MDLSILKKAGISITDFAKLAGVSRMTVYNWIGGAGIKPARTGRVELLLKIIHKAIEAGKLPLPKMPRKERKKQLIEIIKTFYRG